MEKLFLGAADVDDYHLNFDEARRIVLEIKSQGMDVFIVPLAFPKCQASVSPKAFVVEAKFRYNPEDRMIIHISLPLSLEIGSCIKPGRQRFLPLPNKTRTPIAAVKITTVSPSVS